MGLIINIPLETEAGMTIPAGTYVNIQANYEVKGQDEKQVAIRTYISKEARLAEKQPYKIAGFNNLVHVAITQAELDAAPLYTVLYANLAKALEAQFGAGTVTNEI